MQIATIILAGGQGTRLSPLTLHHAKPAVSYGGRYRLIDIPISNAINSGYKEIFLIAQYQAAELQHHVATSYRFDPFHSGFIDVITPEKEWFQGTADAIRKSLPTLLKTAASHFLILSGDHLYNFNFSSFVDFAIEKRADLAIASLPVLEQEARRFGLLNIDPSQKILEFAEKPEDPRPFLLRNQPDHYLASMGIYLFKREALIDLLEQDKREDFGRHLIGTLIAKQTSYAYLYQGYWEDIGTVASYYQANINLTKSAKGLNTYDEANPIYTHPIFLPGPKVIDTRVSHSILCEGSYIEAAEISGSIIGLRSRIGRSTTIRDSVLMGNSLYLAPNHPHQIGKNCLIERAIIDEHVHIGDNVKLVNSKNLCHYDGDGVYIRDGIVIVTARANIPDNFVL